MEAGTPSAEPRSADGHLIVPFALTVFLSAYLLFQVQPLISKLILPWFGGSPSVWTAAMLFFQCMLFGGYLYAHLVATHGSARAQVLMHITLLAAAMVAALFVMPGPEFKPTGDESPTARILLLLAASVGLPYFCLATTGPLVQYWFARSCPSRSAFRLYALSNVGSFLALLSFPYVFEPLFDLSLMGHLWTIGFWVFALLCAAVTLRAGRRIAARHVDANAADANADAASRDGASQPSRPSARQRLAWVLLPALPSLAFIATTDHVSHDIAPEPRLWIATLSLYLLTFIICFDHPRWYRRVPVACATLAGIVLLCGRDDFPVWLGLDWRYGVAGLRWSHLAVMFLICFMCHGELYRRRPAGPRQLTEFYLWMSAGGAFGGLFVALVATNLFADYYEWSLCLALAATLACFILASEAMRARPPVARSLGGRGPSAATREKTVHRGDTSGAHSYGYGLVGITSLASFFARFASTPSTAQTPRRVAGAASLALWALIVYLEDPLSLRGNSGEDYTAVQLEQTRNFYGTVSVYERRYGRDPSASYRVIYSGQVIHGMQYLDAARRQQPLTYYARDSGIGETLDYAMSIKPGIRVAVVGLGAGTLATYARPTDHYDFFEINPEVVRIANQWFDNLPRCLAKSHRVIVGDARLKLEQLPSDLRYDVIALDAFNGGSVPIHLLTREAFQLYRRHLAPGGFIVVHITNTYVNLFPVVRREAQALGMRFRHKYQPADPAHQVRRNHYFVITDDQDYLLQHPSVNRRHYDASGMLVREEDPDLPDIPLWTDQFSSLSPIERKDWR